MHCIWQRMGTGIVHNCNWDAYIKWSICTLWDQIHYVLNPTLLIKKTIYPTQSESRSISFLAAVFAYAFLCSPGLGCISSVQTLFRINECMYMWYYTCGPFSRQLLCRYHCGEAFVHSHDKGYAIQNAVKYSCPL